jgi:hypothetical protein
MPPDALPPDDARDPSSGEAPNVIDPAVLAERRAQRAEAAERRAAQEQTRADRLADERTELEAERDAARAEAAAAREGADAVKAEARHLQAERDELRERLERARAELRAARDEADRAAAAGVAAPPGAPPERDGPAARATAPSGAAAAGGRSRAAALRAGAPARAAAPLTAALERERRMLARRAADDPRAAAALPGERAAPVTALALERERSSRLQARLEESAAAERELRAQLAALERAVSERRDAEQRIEAALARVRADFEQAHRPAGASPTAARPATAAHPGPAEPAGSAAAALASAGSAAAAPSEPTPPGAPPEPAARAAGHATAASAGGAAAPDEPAASAASAHPLDADRLDAARARLRAEPQAAAPEAPIGLPAPWLPRALRHLEHHDPATAGRVLAGLLPAHGLVAQRPLRYDVALAGRPALRVDAAPGTAQVRIRTSARPRRETDLRIATDDAGLARLLLGRRRLLRRRARVRGARRHVRELRRLAQAPLGLRDLARAGVALDPALALQLAALAIPPADTLGRRLTLAHAALAGGAADAWLHVPGTGEPPAVLTARPAQPPDATLRCTRGALLALLAGVEPAPGERGAVDGNADAVTLVRDWIARTEYPRG